MGRRNDRIIGICEYCGGQFDSAAATCPNCGSPLTFYHQSAPQRPRRQRRPRNKIAGAGFVMSIIAAVFGILCCGVPEFRDLFLLPMLFTVLALIFCVVGCLRKQFNSLGVAGMLITFADIAIIFVIIAMM